MTTGLVASAVEASLVVLASVLLAVPLHAIGWTAEAAALPLVCLGAAAVGLHLPAPAIVRRLGCCSLRRAPSMGLALGCCSPSLLLCAMALANVRGVLLPWLEALVGAAPLRWLLSSLTGPGRPALVAYWAAATPIGCVAAACVAPPPLSPEDARRDAEAEAEAEALLALALAAVVPAFALLELVRVGALPPLARPLAAFLAAFIDSRDAGTLVLTHIYLLAGCALPGSAAAAGSTLLALLLLLHVSSPDGAPADARTWAALAGGTAVACLLEAATDQIDNLFLPVAYQTWLLIAAVLEPWCRDSSCGEG
ncbi:hypothetical protein EMIHUDRAFT_225807 [Emiliania huxleyi CCMP1516]|uniref:dolichol kinase n=2 Tax=Emiliania huxleyi TaxID=2903 RepID=A0A0D3KMY8_EMIH1|nr:hypothetical protein EMIHUDRAFT_225807 [Emiliania huxleyi CCMP1516]EOD37123.1 hypothetical protein EMIHUDRAFT_225807 [Emiliania huxleyi CCMP1516]|eukprot:XP_005789552.1 hypothetical protein EMIHUDRAFT_225807 [Emiliania huxleyi CCMP1516]